MTQKVRKTPTRSRARTTRSSIHAIYLFYMERGGYTRFYEIWDPTTPIPDNEVEARIKALTINAFEGKSNPPYYTDIPKFMVMRRSSYVAFAVNANHWNSGASTDIEIKGKNAFGFSIGGDHTFSKAGYFEFEDNGANIDRHRVIYYTNIMASSLLLRNLLDGEKERFTFTLPFASRNWTRFAPDSGGTNMGPPVPPPSRFRGRGKAKAAR